MSAQRSLHAAAQARQAVARLLAPASQARSAGWPGSAHDRRYSANTSAPSPPYRAAYPTKRRFVQLVSYQNFTFPELTQFPFSYRVYIVFRPGGTKNDIDEKQKYHAAV